MSNQETTSQTPSLLTQIKQGLIILGYATEHVELPYVQDKYYIFMRARYPHLSPNIPSTFEGLPIELQNAIRNLDVEDVAIETEQDPVVETIPPVVETVPPVVETQLGGQEEVQQPVVETPPETQVEVQTQQPESEVETQVETQPESDAAVEEEDHEDGTAQSNEVSDETDSEVETQPESNTIAQSPSEENDW